MSQCLEEFSKIIGSVQNIIAALIATGAAVWYNSKKNEHDKDVFKRDLFVSFNSRYELIRDGLHKLVLWEQDINRYGDEIEYEGQKIRQNLSELLEGKYDDDPQPMEPSDLFKPLYKYITLCSEQYYWFTTKNLVDESVWKCWKEAMLRWYTYSDTFKYIIKKEIESNTSYYNSDFLMLFSTKNKLESDYF